MSVWPNHRSTEVALSTGEGALVTLSVSIEPRYLEELLEALANLDFPINPQIYHDAAVISGYEDGHEEIEPTTLVEFPAYESQLPEIRRVLDAYGFDPASVIVIDALNGMHSDTLPEPVGPGARYRTRVRRRHAHIHPIY